MGMYITIIEWDGRTPSTTYYNRMHSLGLFVRGNKDEKSPLTRRAISDGSVIAQEGAVICASESLARAVASYALDDGAAMVQVGVVDSKDYQMTDKDARVMNRIEAIFGRKGRPSGQKVFWAVTCYEEMETWQSADELYATAVCPHCSGGYITGRPGDVDLYRYPGDTKHSHLDRWLAHRFVRGAFEKPLESPDYPEPPKFSGVINNKDEEKAVGLIAKSKTLLKLLDKMPDKTAARVLDAILYARAYQIPDKRTDFRVRACVELIKRKVDATTLPMFESNAEVDLLDAAEVVGVSQIASLWLAVNK